MNYGDYYGTAKTKDKLTGKDKILQEKTRYINKIKELELKQRSIDDEIKEHRKVIKTLDRELESIEQPGLF